jgi:transposase
MKRRRPERIELGIEGLTKILDRAAPALQTEDLATLRAAVDTLAFLTQEIESKGASIQRLRHLMFGPKTETTRTVLGEGVERAGREGRSGGTKHKGHGRNGAAAYRGAERVRVAHASLRHGDACPDCTKGKVYAQSDPRVLVRVKGMAPLRATVYEMDRLRCHLCGKVFTAETPAGLGTEKYDETAASMIALLKYGAGLPFHRLQRLERDLGIPLPAATQWEVVQRAAGSLVPAYEELIRQAAQGEVVHNDDTTMKILAFTGEARGEKAPGAEADERTGVFTSGIVSVGGGRRIALFMTGPKHAGESLAEVLSHRAADRSPPIQMCDALSRNTAGEFATIVGNCVAHARRRYVEVAASFPDECRYVLEILREVYRTDARAQAEGLSPEARLLLHQEESRPRMKTLETWLHEQIDQNLVEPNSGLGEAIGYMRKHWEKLTLFLRVPGAPLDNNICERVLKKAILHRKNAMFYKTENGARVGDIFMSLIHTTELCEANPFDYLVALQRHADAVERDPAAWMPWNYRETITTTGAGSSVGGR